MNDKAIVDTLPTAMYQPGKGFNTIMVDNKGAVVFQKVYATGTDDQAGTAMVAGIKAALLSQAQPRMLFVLADDDAATKLGTALPTYFDSLGAPNLRKLQPKGSYLMVFSVPDSNVVGELFDNTGHVRFVSQGPDPVIDASFGGGSSTAGSTVFLSHRGTLVKYDMSAGKVLSTTQLTDTQLPAPFNSRMDTVIDLQNSSNLLITRGNFWIIMTPDLSTRVDGPNTIGQGAFTLALDPFTKGLDASARAPNGSLYIFRGNKWARLSKDLRTVQASGQLGAKDSEFVGLPAKFAAKIDAGYADASGVGLMSGDQWLIYSTDKQAVVTGPEQSCIGPKVCCTSNVFQDNRISAFASLSKSYCLQK